MAAPSRERSRRFGIPSGQPHCYRDNGESLDRRTQMVTSDDTKTPPQTDLSRRNIFKGATAGLAAVGLSAIETTSAQAQTAPPPMPKNPYGGGPGKGLQFPPYYQPTPSVRSRMNYFP